MTTPRSRGRSSWRHPPTSPSSWWGSDRTRRARRHPRRRSTCPGASSSSCSASPRPARPSSLVVVSGRPLDLRWADEHVPRSCRPGTRARAAAMPSRPARRRRLARRPAALHLATSRRPGAPGLRAHCAPSSRTTRARATSRRTAPRSTRSGMACRYAAFEYTDLRVDRDRDRRRRERHRYRRGPQHLGSDRRRGGAALHPPAPRHLVASGPGAQGVPAHHPRRQASSAQSRSRSAPSSSATGARPPADVVQDATTIDIWVGGDSTAQLTTTLADRRTLTMTDFPVDIPVGSLHRSAPDRGQQPQQRLVGLRAADAALRRPAATPSTATTATKRTCACSPTRG